MHVTLFTVHQASLAVKRRLASFAIPYPVRTMAKAKAKKKAAAKRYTMYNHNAESSQASSRAVAFNAKTGRVKITKKVLNVKVNDVADEVEHDTHESTATQHITEVDLGMVIVAKRPAKRYLNSVSCVSA